MNCVPVYGSEIINENRGIFYFGSTFKHFIRFYSVAAHSLGTTVLRLLENVCTVRIARCWTMSIITKYTGYRDRAPVSDYSATIQITLESTRDFSLFNCTFPINTVCVHSNSRRNLTLPASLTRYFLINDTTFHTSQPYTPR